MPAIRASPRGDCCVKTPLSVAIVSREYPPFYGGGIGTYARWIVPALAAAGVRVHVITQAYDRTCPRLMTEGLVTTHRIQVGMGHGGWPNAAVRFSIRAARLIASLTRQGRIDVAEFAECEAAGIASLLFNSARPPTIVQLHTPSELLFELRSHTNQRLDVPHRFYFELERMAMNLADEILAPSHFIADWARAQYDFKRPPAVIPYATGHLPAPPPAADDEGGRVVLYAGRIEPRKGVEPLILSMNRVMRDDESVRLRLAGADTSGSVEGGSMRAYLQTLLGAHASDRVEFLGRLNAAHLHEEYARASICVIPSLWENFPNTCIESMSHARAVIVSDNGGMREMVGDTDAGLIFKAGDPDDLCRALSKMLSESRERLDQRGTLARKRIEAMCHPNTIAQKRVQHYQEVIDRYRSSSPAQNTSCTLSEWRGIEESLSGDLRSFNTPTIPQALRHWVEREPVPAC
jgi:glycosyltransferase involved in cell wall biosynthesis